MAAAPPDVAIAPDTLTAERPLPRLATGGLCRLGVGVAPGAWSAASRMLLRRHRLRAGGRIADLDRAGGANNPQARADADAGFRRSSAGNLPDMDEKGGFR